MFSYHDFLEAISATRNMGAKFFLRSFAACLHDASNDTMRYELLADFRQFRH